MIRFTPLSSVLLLAAALLAAGCNTAPKQTGGHTLASQQRSVETRSGAAARAGNLTRAEAMMRPTGRVMTTAVRAGVMPRGSVPYDDLTLPIICPDGRYLATQTGVSPAWPTILAEADGGRPAATRIEVYRIDGREPQLAGEPHAGLLLGRNADTRGFLVESPREDGSRWIGFIEWESGELTWLVADAFVNAFAALGPNGRLAWSRRAVDEADFQLVVRRGENEWTFPTGTSSGYSGDSSAGGSGGSGGAVGGMLMPTWSGRGTGLFAFSLRDGFLDAVFGQANDAVTMRQSLRRIALSAEASAFDAFQAMAAHTAPAGGDGAAHSGPDELVFFHPAAWQTAVWRPLTMRGNAPIFVPGRSFSAVLASRDAAAVARGESEFALVCTEKALVVQNLGNARDRAEILAGMLVPRATASAQWPYLLLAPGEGHIGLTSLTLVPADEGLLAQ